MSATLRPPWARAGLAQSRFGRPSARPCRRTYFTCQWAAQLTLHRAGGRRCFSQQTPKRPKPATKLEWHPIPIGLGIGLLGLIQFYKVYTREQDKDYEGGESEPKPKKRPRVRPDGPWYAHLKCCTTELG